MTDVGPGSGPLEYIPDSARGGPYSQVWPWKPLGEMYPPQEKFAARVPVDSKVRVMGLPPGTPDSVRHARA